MSLFPSVVTSLAIVCLIWSLATFQPNNAVASPILTNTSNTVLTKKTKENAPTAHKEQTTEQVKKVSNSLYFDKVQISGVTQKTYLNQLPNLWKDFNNNKALQKSLKKNPSKIFVYYRDFSSSYESAIVSIGFDTQEMKPNVNKTNLPTTPFSVLVSRGKYDDSQLKGAWNKIDYRQSVLAVVEVHYLNADSTVDNSEIFVSYK